MQRLRVRLRELRGEPKEPAFEVNGRVINARAACAGWSHAGGNCALPEK